MTTIQSRPVSSLAPRHRIVFGLSGAATAATVFVAVATLFAQASGSAWLPDTPAARAIAQACDQSPSRQVRDSCMQSAVARRQAAGRALAEAGPAVLSLHAQ